MGLLGKMTVRFGADVSGLSKGASQAKGILAQFASNPVAAVAGGFALAGAAVIGFAASSVKAAGDFQQSMLKVQAYAGLSKQQADAMSNSILNMAQVVGQSPKALADALYPIISAGYGASDALNILKLSAMTAAASGADTASVADGLTTALKAMGAPASMAGFYMDVINKTVSVGKMEIPGYAAVIGKLSLSAASAKVPFVDMNAALATLTTHGFPSVAQASTSLGNLFTQIGVKTDALEQHAKNLKLAFYAHAFSTMSLSQKLDYLQKITGGNQSEILKLLGGSTLALKAFNALRTGSGAYTDNLKALKGATGATASTFATASSGFNQSMNRVHASIDVLKIKIGSALLPALTGISNAVAPLITNFANWIEKNHIVEKAINFVKDALNILKGVLQTVGNIINGTIQTIQNIYGWFVQWHDPIMAVAGAITLFFLPAMIKAGVQAAISGGQIAAGFISNLVATGAAAIKNAATVTTEFVASMVKAGAAAWVQGGKIVGGFVASMVSSGAAAIKNAAIVTAQFIASMVKAGAQAVVTGAQVVGGFIASLVEAGIQATITAGAFLADLIPSVITFATEALAAAATAIPAILIGFGAWIVGAAGVAIANIAAFWPIYLVILVIIGVIALIVLAIKNWGAICKWIGGIINNVKEWFVNAWHDIQAGWNFAINFFKKIGDGIGKAFSGLGTFIHNVWEGIKNSIKNAINWVIGGINNFINFLDGLHISIPKIQIGSVSIGGGDIRLPHIPDIPLLAKGGVVSSGAFIAGEQGPEMIFTRGGARVLNNSQTSAALAGGGGEQTIILELDGQQLAKIVGHYQQKQIRLKMGRKVA